MGFGGDEHDDGAPTYPPTTTIPTSAGPRSPTRSTGSGCTRASSRQLAAATSAPRPQAALDHARCGRRGRRDPDPRRAGRGRCARPVRPEQTSDPNVVPTSTPIATAARRGRRRGRLGRRRQRARQARHATRLGSLRPPDGRDPHQRPARRQTRRRSTSPPPTASCTRPASSAATRPPTSCCSTLRPAGAQRRAPTRRAWPDATSRAGRTVRLASAPGRGHRVGRRRTEPRRLLTVDEQRARRVDRQPRRRRERADHEWPARDRGRVELRLHGRCARRPLRRRDRHRPLAGRRRSDDLRGADLDRDVDRERPSDTRLRDARRPRASTASTRSAGPTVTSVIAGGPAAVAGRARRRHHRIRRPARGVLDGRRDGGRAPRSTREAGRGRASNGARPPSRSSADAHQHGRAVTAPPDAPRIAPAASRRTVRASMGRHRTRENRMTTRAEQHELDDVDRELLNAVQWDFPARARPYAALGERLGHQRARGARAHRQGQGGGRAAPALGDLRHARARLHLGARSRPRSTPTTSTKPPPSSARTPV